MVLLYFQTRQIKESLTYHPFWAKCAFNQISNSNGSNKGGLQDEVKVKVNKKVYKVTIKIMNQNIVINRQPISQVTMGKFNSMKFIINPIQMINISKKLFFLSQLWVNNTEYWKFQWVCPTNRNMHNWLRMYKV